MKTNWAKNKSENQGAVKSLAKACLGSCRKIMAQIRAVKEVIYNESRVMLKSNQRMVQLALNEAEALAEQTMYPHLVFPVLAQEKVQTVAEWSVRQERLRQSRDVRAFA